MIQPKLRIIAGPNGSGKTTLFTELRTKYDFNVGFFLNPDDLDQHLKKQRRFNIADCMGTTYHNLTFSCSPFKNITM